MYKFSEESRVPRIDEVLVTEQRCCPYDAEGIMQRVAQRDHMFPYHWFPVGWRCTHCGTMFMDLRKGQPRFAVR